MSLNVESLKKLALTVRMLSVDGVQKANSGHPGMPMGAADYASVLWANYLRVNPKDTTWAGRDRFILSAGHGSMLLYSLLHLFGFGVSLKELQSFRQWESLTPGHPEFGMTPGVDTTTGPLGAGFSNGVGMAMSAKLLQARYSKELFDYKVYGIVSDGDLMEGVAAEAASLAGHLALNNLIYLYDDNQISLAGATKICFTESVAKRFEAYGWYVQSVDGHDIPGIAKCIENAKAEPSRPSIICCKSIIGFGSPNKQGTFKVHGEPLGEDEVKLTKEKLGWPLEPKFLIPKEVGEYCASLIEAKQGDYAKWQKDFSDWSKKNPELAKAYAAQSAKEINFSALRKDLLAAFADGKKKATRELSSDAIQVIAKNVPFFIGGSADLEPSTKTTIKDSPDIQANAFAGRNIRFGVREHAMGGAVNGLAYTGQWIPYSATFLVFSDYMRPTIRLAALSHLQSLFIFTHDSFWVGEDGPTHEPIEHVEALRCIPNLKVFRPADGVEVALCYEAALAHKKGPSTLLFTRQGVPALPRGADFNPDDILKGAYIVHGKENTDAVIVATGSEVWVAIEAAKALTQAGTKTRVVSMPCVELFLAQDKAFKESLIPAKSKRISLEAGITSGWSRIVGSDALKIGIDHYGASAPGELLAEKFGFTPDAVTKKIQAFL